MAENLGKWRSGHRKTEKSDHPLAGEGVQFPWLQDGGTITLKLGVIWEMSAEDYIFENYENPLQELHP